MNNNELKPRRWLLVVFLIIAIAIVVVLLNKLIIDHNERKKNGTPWGIFNTIRNQMESSNSDFEETKEKIEDGYNNIQEEIKKQEEEQKKQQEETNRESFNRTFETRTGTNRKVPVGWALDDVITNNKTNSEHIITVVFESTTTSDPNEIKNIKKRLQDWTDYEVSVDYDDNGYVNKLTIEK